MLGFKKLYKAFAPPILDSHLKLHLKKFRRKGGYFTGPFKNWEEAKKNSKGYDEISIINRIKESTLIQKQKNIFVRDGIELDKADHSFPLTTALLFLLLNKDQINVLDFGGGLGSTYYNFKTLIQNTNIKLNWHVVEQPHFVKIGSAEHQTNELSFSYNINLIKSDIDILILSSVLQYLHNPLEYIIHFKKKLYPYIFIDRIISHFNPDHSTSIMVEQVPTFIYKASYPCYVFNYQEILNAFIDHYDIVYEFNANEGRQNLGNIDVLYKGVLLKLK